LKNENILRYILSVPNLLFKLNWGGIMYCPNCGNICVEINDGGIKRNGCQKCNYINYKNPYPCISVLIINKENKVLLGKRHKDSIYPEKWCMPCGYMEYDESFREAAIREIKEEVGLTIIPRGIIMENKNIPIITFEGSMFCDL